jgi:hypothetical protein
MAGRPKSRGAPGPDILTGYRQFSSDKLREMVLFFAQEGIFETKIHKELWYADCAHFRDATISISGETYVRNHFGPTLREYPILDVLREWENWSEKKRLIVMVRREEKILCITPL